MALLLQLQLQCGPLLRGPLLGACVAAERLYAVTSRARRSPRQSAAAAAAAATAAAAQEAAAAAAAKAPPSPPPAAQQHLQQQQEQQQQEQQQQEQQQQEQRRRPPPQQSPRAAALRTAMQHLNKKLGDGTVFQLGESAHGMARPECISSGCLSLDAALGGGWARGRIVEVFGPESSGKSTLALHSIAEVQRTGGQAVLVDAEHAFSREFAHKVGVNVGELVIVQPSCGEDALEVVDTLLRSRGVDLIVLDSVAALLPRVEQEGEMGMSQVALQARMMSQGLRKLAGSASKTNTTVLFVNQLRSKVGVFFGNPETTAGGNALKYYASQRVDVRVRERVKAQGGDTDVGVRVRAKVVKNKVAPPYRSAEFVILFTKGVDATAGLLDAGEMLGLVAKRGSHFYVNGERLGQGRAAVAAALAKQPELRERLRAAVTELLASPDRLEAALTRHSGSEDEEGSEEEVQQQEEGVGARAG